MFPPTGFLRPLLVAASLAATAARPVGSPAQDAAESPARTPANAEEAPAPDDRAGAQDLGYIRFADDDASARLELAVRSFARDEGALVDLVSVVHIADESYYQALNRRLAEYDVVLYELVGDPFEKPGTSGEDDPEKTAGDAAKADEADEGFSILRVLYTAVGKFLRLSFQLQCIDYTQEHFVHADVSREEFESMQDEQGESLATLMARAMEVQSGEESRDAVRELQDFNPAKLLMMLLDPKAADEFKSILARVMAGSEKQMAKAEEKEATVILTRRNEVAVAKLREILARSPQPRRIAIFYGAAHMTGIGAELERSLAFRPTGVVWLPAWTMPHPGATTPAAPAGDPAPEPAVPAQ